MYVKYFQKKLATWLFRVKNKNKYKIKIIRNKYK